MKPGVSKIFKKSCWLVSTQLSVFPVVSLIPATGQIFNSSEMASHQMMKPLHYLKNFSRALSLMKMPSSVQNNFLFLKGCCEEQRDPSS